MKRGVFDAVITCTIQAFFFRQPHTFYIQTSLYRSHKICKYDILVSLYSRNPYNYGGRSNSFWVTVILDMRLELSFSSHALTVMKCLLFIPHFFFIAYEKIICTCFFNSCINLTTTTLF